MRFDFKRKRMAGAPAIKARPLTLREVLRLRDGLGLARDLQPTRAGRLPALRGPMFSLN